jgi:general nucleoside transport system permease protein
VFPLCQQVFRSFVRVSLAMIAAEVVSTIVSAETTIFALVEEDAMAASTLEQPSAHQELPTLGFGERARQLALRVTPTLSAALVGVLTMTLIGSLLIIITAPGGLSFFDRFNIASAAYSLLVAGSFGNGVNISNTLDALAPLVLAGFAVAVAFRAGLFNIGAGGQIAIGGTVAVILGIKFYSAPGWVLGPLVLLGGMVGGAVWGGIVGLLKAWRGAHEVVTTIMLNFVAFYLSAYIVECSSGCIPGIGSIRVASKPSSMQVGPGAPLPLLSHIFNQVFPGSIANEISYRANVGLFIALAGVVVYWFLMKRTTLGYEIQAVGQSQKAARYAGINVKRNIIVTMLIAGAFAGIAGAVLVMSPDFPGQSISDTTFSTDQTGFNAISVALLGLNGPIGVLLAGLLFAGLGQGAGLMQSDSGLFASTAVQGLPTNYSVNVQLIQFAFQAMVLLVIAGHIVPQFRTMLRQLLASLMGSFRSEVARLPSLILGLIALADVVAVIAFVGFIIVSLISLQSVVSLDATVSAIYSVSLGPLFDLLLVFYAAGILLLLLTIGIGLSGRWRKRAVAPSLLVEAIATSEALVTAPVSSHAPPTSAETGADGPADASL